MFPIYIYLSKWRALVNSKQHASSHLADEVKAAPRAPYSAKISRYDSEFRLIRPQQKLLVYSNS